MFRRTILLFLLSTSFLHAQDASSTKQYQFASWLFDKGEYFRAIGEFERFKYFNLASKDIAKADFYIALSYFNARQYTEAQLSFLKLTNAKDLSWKARLLAGDSFFLTENNDYSFFLYQTVEEGCTDPNLQAYSLSGMAWSKLMQRDFQTTLSLYDTFLKKYPTHVLASEIEYLNNSVDDISRFKPLSPVFAGILSTVIPGAGQVYDKRPGDGVVAFLTISALGSASYLLWRYYEHKEIAIGFSLATAFFYAGNIYSAWSSAKKYNNLYYKKNIQYLKDTYWRSYKVEKP